MNYHFVNIELTDLSFLHPVEIRQVFRFFSMQLHSFLPNDADDDI